jgi:hypothetical protein
MRHLCENMKRKKKQEKVESEKSKGKREEAGKSRRILRFSPSKELPSRHFSAFPLATLLFLLSPALGHNFFKPSDSVRFSVRPGKASVFSRSQSCYGKSQKPYS